MFWTLYIHEQSEYTASFVEIRYFLNFFIYIIVLIDLTYEQTN